MSKRHRRKLATREFASRFDGKPVGEPLTDAQATILLEEVTIKQGLPWGGARGVVNHVGEFVPGRGTSIKVWLTGRKFTIRCSRDDVRPARADRASVFHAYDRAVKLGLGWSGEKLQPGELM